MPACAERFGDAGAGDETLSLAAASLFGRADIVAKVLEEGAPVDSTDTRGWSALHFAAAAGALPVVSLLLESGGRALRNLRNDFGDDALAVAVVHGQHHVVQRLLEAGAGARVAERTNVAGNSALHLAALNGALGIARLLLHDCEWVHVLRPGACATAARLKRRKQRRERRSGEKAEAGGSDVAELDAKEAEDSEADVCVDEVASWRRADLTPLQCALRHNQAELVDLLIRHGASVDRDDEHRQDAPLHTAAAKGFRNVVVTLICYGADVNAVNGEGRTALAMAVKHGHVAVANALIEAGASDLNTPASDARGFTHLMRACHEGREELVTCLLSHLDVEQVAARVERSESPWFGDSALEVASRSGNWQCCELLVKGVVAKNVALLQAHYRSVMGQECSEDLLMRLITMREARVANQVCLSAWCVCALCDRAPLCTWQFGETPLHCAAGNGDLHAVRRLLHFGADVNATSNCYVCFALFLLLSLVILQIVALSMVTLHWRLPAQRIEGMLSSYSWTKVLT